eukprot:4956857-Pyramimonas_sp.AAC.1
MTTTTTRSIRAATSVLCTLPSISVNSQASEVATSSFRLSGVQIGLETGPTYIGEWWIGRARRRPLRMNGGEMAMVIFLLGKNEFMWEYVRMPPERKLMARRPTHP